MKAKDTGAADQREEEQSEMSSEGGFAEQEEEEEEEGTGLSIWSNMKVLDRMNRKDVKPTPAE